MSRFCVIKLKISENILKQQEVSMSYSNKSTIEQIEKELESPKTLYKSNCVNWSGKTNDTSEYYSEVIAEHLLKEQNFEAFDEGGFKVTRENQYFRENHNMIGIDLESNRKEDIFAKRIAYLNLGKLGTIIDYQIPLKNTNKDIGLGKVDLVSFNEKTMTLYLIELKYGENIETLLRASLECFTYLKTIDKKKLLDDFNSIQGDLKKLFNRVNHEAIVIKPAVLVSAGCNAYVELCDMKKGNRPNLKALSQKMDMSFFTTEIKTNQIEL